MIDGPAQPAPAPAPEPPPSPPSAAPREKIVLWGYVAVAVAAVAAVIFAINDKVFDISITVDTDDFQWFALLYIAAQAIERLLEPMMGQVKAGEVAVAKAGVAAAVGDEGKATKQTVLSQVQADRAVIAWAAASTIALVTCGILGLGMIESLANVDVAEGRSADVFTAFDVIFTGLVIGAGTKPLHDLITKIEKSKNRADPETGP